MKPGRHRICLPVASWPILLAILLTGLLAGLPAASPGRALEPELQGVVTQLGDCTKCQIEPFGEDRKPRLLVAGDLVRQRDRIIVSDGSLGLMCSTDRWVRLEGKTTWTLSASACSEGLKVDPGIFRTLVPPKTGRWLQSDGTLVMESAIRGAGPQGLLLSPRNTKVKDPRPDIRWLEMPSAVEYEISVRGARPQRVSGNNLQCGPDPAWDNERVCTLPWPSTHPGLRAGRMFFIDMAYREAIASPAIRGSDPPRVELLAGEPALSESRKLEQLRQIAAGGLQLAVLEAKHFVDHELYMDAILAYRRALEFGGGPPIRVTLGEIYAGIGLRDFARRSYRQADDESDDPAIQASVSLGLGQLAAKEKDFSKASRLFARSRDLYRQLGFEELTAIAEQAADEAARRIRVSE